MICSQRRGVLGWSGDGSKGFSQRHTQLCPLTSHWPAGPGMHTHIAVHTDLPQCNDMCLLCHTSMHTTETLPHGILLFCLYLSPTPHTCTDTFFPSLCLPINVSADGGENKKVSLKLSYSWGRGQLKQARASQFPLSLAAESRLICPHTPAHHAWTY